MTEMTDTQAPSDSPSAATYGSAWTLHGIPRRDIFAGLILIGALARLDGYKRLSEREHKALVAVQARMAVEQADALCMALDDLKEQNDKLTHGGENTKDSQ